MCDLRKVIRGLELCEYLKGMPQCDSCPYDGKDCWARLKRDALSLLKAQGTRMLTADEIKAMHDGSVLCVEQLLSREDGERGYVTGSTWGVMCNRNGKEGDGMIVSMLGTFLTETISEIPYKTTYTGRNGKRRVGMYRFWTARPTEQQSKAVKWDE